ncbi:MAG: tyrosine-type recombinase/integrase, partial [Acidiferrobacter thiooxydans]
AYRDAFRLLLQWFEETHHKLPEELALTDLEAHRIAAFLDYLETERHNTIRSRNARFAALRSFLRFAARQEPAAMGTIQGVLALPMKRFERPLLGYLTREEIEALLEAPDGDTWCGQRDRVMFATLYNTGARVSELIGLTVGDVVLEGSPCVHLHGKGRKQRSVPLWRANAHLLRQWLRHYPRERHQRLFPNRTGGPMTRTGVTDRLQLAVFTAAQLCPTLAKRRISPHTVRHATAMHLLQAGVDITVIALWLGHESTTTTHMYVEADLAMKEQALNALQAPSVKSHRFRPTKGILAFLEGL